MAPALAGVSPIAIGPVAARRDLAVELGAGIALHPTSESFQEDLASAGGIDSAFDTSGHQEVVSALFGALNPGAQMVLVAAPMPPVMSTPGR